MNSGDGDFLKNLESFFETLGEFNQDGFQNPTAEMKDLMERRKGELQNYDAHAIPNQLQNFDVNPIKIAQTPSCQELLQQAISILQQAQQECCQCNICTCSGELHSCFSSIDACLLSINPIRGFATMNASICQNCTLEGSGFAFRFLSEEDVIIKLTSDTVDTINCTASSYPPPLPVISISGNGTFQFGSNITNDIQYTLEFGTDALIGCFFSLTATFNGAVFFSTGLCGTDARILVPCSDITITRCTTI